MKTLSKQLDFWAKLVVPQQGVNVNEKNRKQKRAAKRDRGVMEDSRGRIVVNQTESGNEMQDSGDDEEVSARSSKRGPGQKQNRAKRPKDLSGNFYRVSFYCF